MAILISIVKSEIGSLVWVGELPNISPSKQGFLKDHVPVGLESGPGTTSVSILCLQIGSLILGGTNHIAPS